MKHSNQILKSIKLLVIGVSIGTIASFFIKQINTQKKDQIKNQVKSKTQRLQKIIQTYINNNPVAQAFDEITPQTELLFYKANFLLINKMDQLKQSNKEITPEKYQTIINNIISEIEKQGEYTKDQLDAIRTYSINQASKYTTNQTQSE